MNLSINPNPSKSHMKNVVVTGASRGIGLGLVKYYSKSYNVYALCRNASNNLKNLQVNVVEGMDMLEPKTFPKLKEKLGDVSIDLLILCAGIYPRDTLETLKYEDMLNTLKVNTIAPIFCVQALKPCLSQEAKIAFITSRMGSISEISSGRSYSYRASKSGLNAIGKTLSVELKESNIPVGIYHPGPVKTDMTGEAPYSVEECVSYLSKRIEELTMDLSGKFIRFEGDELPW